MVAPQIVLNILKEIASDECLALGDSVCMEAIESARNSEITFTGVAGGRNADLGDALTTIGQVCGVITAIIECYSIWHKIKGKPEQVKKIKNRVRTEPVISNESLEVVIDSLMRAEE